MKILSLTNFVIGIYINFLVNASSTPLNSKSKNKKSIANNKPFGRSSQKRKLSNGSNYNPNETVNPISKTGPSTSKKLKLSKSSKFNPIISDKTTIVPTQLELVDCITKDDTIRLRELINRSKMIPYSVVKKLVIDKNFKVLKLIHNKKKLAAPRIGKNYENKSPVILVSRRKLAEFRLQSSVRRVLTASNLLHESLVENMNFFNEIFSTNDLIATECIFHAFNLGKDDKYLMITYGLYSALMAEADRVFGFILTFIKGLPDKIAYFIHELIISNCIKSNKWPIFQIYLDHRKNDQDLSFQDCSRIIQRAIDQNVGEIICQIIRYSSTVGKVTKKLLSTHVIQAAANAKGNSLRALISSIQISGHQSWAFVSTVTKAIIKASEHWNQECLIVLFEYCRSHLDEFDLEDIFEECTDRAVKMGDYDALDFTLRQCSINLNLNSLVDILENRFNEAIWSADSMIAKITLRIARANNIPMQNIITMALHARARIPFKIEFFKEIMVSQSISLSKLMDILSMRLTVSELDSVIENVLADPRFNPNYSEYLRILNLKYLSENGHICALRKVFDSLPMANQVMEYNVLDIIKLVDKDPLIASLTWNIHRKCASFFDKKYPKSLLLSAHKFSSVCTWKFNIQFIDAILGRMSLSPSERCQMNMNSIRSEEVIKLCSTLHDQLTSISIEKFQRAIRPFLTEDYIRFNDCKSHNCVVCLENFDQTERLGIIFSCHPDHKIHQNCLLRYIMSNQRCPICRHDLFE